MITEDIGTGDFFLVDFCGLNGSFHNIKAVGTF